MTTRDATAAETSLIGGWINLRDDEGNIQGRFNPDLLVLIIQHRGKRTIHDLKRHRQGEHAAQQGGA